MRPCWSPALAGGSWRHGAPRGRRRRTGPAATWVARRRLSGAWATQAVAPPEAAATVPGLAVDDGTADSAAGALATVAYSRREGDRRVLAVRSAPLGTIAPAEDLLGGPGAWTDVAAAAGGRTTVVVAARAGGPLTLFSRSGAG